MNIVCRITRKIYNYLFLLLYKNKNNIFIGKNFTFRSKIIINCKKDAILKIGNNVFFNNYCSINCHRKVKIGNDCLFGENVKIYDHNHRFNNKNLPIKEQGYVDKEIIIGNNCWFGSNVIILPNTIIGNNVVVSAGLVVSGIIPDNTLVKRSKEYLIFEDINYSD